MNQEKKEHSRSLKKLFWRIGRLIVLLYVAVSLLGCAFANNLIFRPHASSYKEGPPYFKLESGPDKLGIGALYLPAPSARYTVLYSHGNGEDLGDVKNYLQELHGRGFSVMAYEYRGYGTSQGKPSEGGCYEDINAAYAHLTGKLGVKPQNIIVFGRSVGGGPATDLASREPVGGLILESSFVTAFRVATGIPLLPFDKFRNISKIGNVKCPVLIIHGTKDQVIGFWHSERLFAAANEPKTFVPVKGAGHNNVLYCAGEDYWKAVRDYASRLEAKAND